MTDSPPVFSATAADLPVAVAAALAAPPDPRILRVVAGSIEFAAREWAASGPPPGGGTAGETGGSPLRAGEPPPRPPAPATILLLHGITNSSMIWWRIGAALAAAGRRVVAVDSPAHGETRGWEGGSSSADTGRSIAAFVRAYDPSLVRGTDTPGLGVVGHSWGSLVAATLPAIGLRPGRLVLLDPPYLDDAGLRAVIELTIGTLPPVEATLAQMEAAIAAENPAWHPRDVAAKAKELLQIDRERVLAIGRGNSWDGGLTALEAGIRGGYPAERCRIVRGIPALGGMLPDAILPRFRSLLGEAAVTTLADSPHTPQRTHPEALTAALLRALD